MMKQHLAILCDNKPGVLTHVAGLISRRAINIEYINAGYTEEPDVTRINIVVSVEDQRALNQAILQLARLIDVIKVVNLAGKLPIDKMDTSDIARLMFDTKNFAEIRGDALAVKNMILRANDRLALTVITKANLAAEGITENDIGGAVDVVRSAAGVLVGVSLKETNPGAYRISARSNCSFDVAAVCEKFGGGGHARAAGCNMSGNVYDCVNNLSKYIEKQLDASSEGEEQDA